MDQSGFVFIIVFIAIIAFFVEYLQLNKKEVKKKKEQPTVRLCPNCGSSEIITDFSIPAIVQYGAPLGYRCENCGLRSPFALDVDKKKENYVRKKLHGKTKKTVVYENHKEKINSKIIPAFIFGGFIIFIASLFIGDDLLVAIAAVIFLTILLIYALSRGIFSSS
jgi:predicted RNA-binding Zn-ribbon protein involved in translation (DUF1610 family)